jgi:methylmalonyl-CoA mutase C-terminal domain/subunit
MVLGLLGMDSHENGAIAVASLLRDAGVEVIYLGRYQTPDTLLRAAVQEDVDVIGVSCHSWEYLEYLPALMERIPAEAPDVAVVAGGSVITPADAARLTALGVAAVFGSGAAPEHMVATVRRLAAARREALELPPAAPPGPPAPTPT